MTHGPGSDLTSGSGTARDSLTVSACTIVSRGTGLVRVVLIGAVLGPTYFGNTYQLTNQLPNLMYFGFLAGSMFAGLLVPALVRHIDAASPRDITRVSGGFLGVAFAVLAAVAPVAVVVFPAVLHLATAGLERGEGAAGQAELARLMVVLTIPQVFLYAVVGSSTALMNAHRKFAVAAAAPAVENIGIIAVLVLVHQLYGAAPYELRAVPTSEILLLGLGSTAAVGAHAAVQWLGARRTGAVLRPRAGWRDPEVRQIMRRASRSLVQSGLLALQLLVMFLVANRVAGGSVALQIALNFYYLPLALAATPVGLALLPRLSRMDHADGSAEFAVTFGRGLSLALFLAVPAACGYVMLAGVIAHAFAGGQMQSPLGLAMVTGALGALAVGLAGETVFFVTTQSSYARKDTATPLVSMMLQTGVCLALCALAAAVANSWVLVGAVGLSYAIASLVGATHLLRRMSKGFVGADWTIWRSVLRILLGAAVMVLPVELAVHLLTSVLDGRMGWVLALAGGTVAGLVSYLAFHALARSPELGWFLSGTRRRAAAVPDAGEAVP